MSAPAGGGSGEGRGGGAPKAPKSPALPRSAPPGQAPKSPALPRSAPPGRPTTGKSALGQREGADKTPSSGKPGKPPSSAKPSGQNAGTPNPTPPAAPGDPAPDTGGPDPAAAGHQVLTLAQRGEWGMLEQLIRGYEKGTPEVLVAEEVSRTKSRLCHAFAHLIKISFLLS